MPFFTIKYTVSMSSFWSKYFDVLLHLNIFFYKTSRYHSPVLKAFTDYHHVLPLHLHIRSVSRQVFGRWQLFPAFLQDRCYLLLGLLNINYATLRSNYKQLNNGDVIELEQRLILLTFSHSLDFTFSCLSICSSVSPALLLLISLKTIF